MASTYSSNYRFELMGTGDQTNTWGVTMNGTIGTLLEAALSGYATVNMASDANYTLTTNNGATDEARERFIKVTSTTLTATRDVIVPTIEKDYVVWNATTGSQSIRVKTSAGTGITIPNGKIMWVVADGTNVIDAINNLPSGTTIGGSTVGTVTSVALSGGTTGLTVSGSPITSSGTITLAGTLAVANGGTGATTASAALSALGGMPLAGGTFTGAPNITYADNGAAGLELAWDLNSASPAASDVLVFVNFKGRDSGGNVTTYAQLVPVIADPNNGSEDGEIYMSAMVAGSLAERLRAKASGVAITGALDLTGSIATIGSLSGASIGAETTNLVFRRSADTAMSVATNLFGFVVSGSTTGACGTIGFQSSTNAKAWVYADSVGTISASLNVTSVTHNGTGDYTINFTTALPSANYTVFGMGEAVDGQVNTTVAYKSGDTRTTSAVQVRVKRHDAAVNSSFNVVIFGTGV